MQHPGAKRMALIKLWSILAVVLALPLAADAVPARAEGLFGLFRLFSPPAAPEPTYQPLEALPDPALERPKPKMRPRPKPASIEQAKVKIPIVPKAPGEIENPVPALLADNTLRPGDMVMFPDGLRVFTGEPGRQHTMADFKPLLQAGKAVSRATRKLIAKLIPGENVAWSTDGVRSGGKLVVNTKDVAVTGGVRRVGR